jgi:hypothetical protein
MRTVMRGLGAPKWLGEVITEFSKGDWSMLSTEQNGPLVSFAVRGVYSHRPDPVDVMVTVRADDLLELTPVQLFPMFPAQLRELLQLHIDRLSLAGPLDRSSDALATR